jgi:hypothetical protein
MIEGSPLGSARTKPIWLLVIQMSTYPVTMCAGVIRCSMPPKTIQAIWASRLGELLDSLKRKSRTWSSVQMTNAEMAGCESIALDAAFQRKVRT